MKHLAILASVVGLLACCAPPAFARTPPVVRPAVCADHATHRAYLAKRYGEHPAFSGGLAHGRVLHIFVNRRTGSWTLTIRRADGQSCVVGAGIRWRRDDGV